MTATPYLTDQWYVSPWDFYPEATKDFKINPKVKIHDVTLREGEQQPGIVFTRDDKVAIAKKLAELGVDRIEAGMPAVSQEDEDAMKAIVDLNLGPEIFAFCRCLPGDVEKAKKAGCHGAMLEVAVNPKLVEGGFGKTMDWARKAAIEATIAAKEVGLYTAFFTMDGTRTEINQLLDTVDAIREHGRMDALVVPDTYGCLHPWAVYPMFRKLKEHMGKIPVEAHMHMDFGLGAANTLAAVAAGADAAHVSISGIGGGSGNTPLEDVALSLKVLFGVNTRIKTEKFCEVSQFVCAMTNNHPLPPNRPIVGRDILAVDSGQGAMVIERAEKMGTLKYILGVQPSLIGQPGFRYMLGKKCGTAMIERFLREIGKTLSEEKVKVMVEKVKVASVKKRRMLTIDEFKEMVEEVSKQ
jgi:isopropylmalate/homocitrate/citramalate synthase